MKRREFIIGSGMLMFGRLVIKIPSTLYAGENKEILIPTFLGNNTRSFYGAGEIPNKLDVIWVKKLGSGQTRVGHNVKTWSGTGWTGQPTLVKEGNKKYLVIGSLDHKLRKLDSENGREVWQYSFDDAIKGTSTLYKEDEEIIILQGSRIGFDKDLSSELTESFRAVSYDTGKEKWRLNIKRTDSYSRDVDSSPLVIDNKIYLFAENGTLMVLNPNKLIKHDNHFYPQIIKEIQLYTKEDIIFHRGNLVAESSPSLLEDILYYSAGSGHVYGINKNSLDLTWDFYIGSDIDGSVTISEDKRLFVPIEKQYISGKGGILKLNPENKTVEWFFPTENKKIATWEGGVIGSIAISDKLKIVSSNSIDGNLYVLSQNEISDIKVDGPNIKEKYDSPKLIDKEYVGPSIATPIMVGNRILSPTYNGLFSFEIDNKLRMIDKLEGITFESTPIVDGNRAYIGSKNGNFYCLGEL